MKELKPKGPAPKLSPKELDELTREALRNLSDPDVRKQVDAAEVQLEEKIKEAFGKRMLQKEKTKKNP
ncbi:MAG: hypothetical protein ABSC37_21805 [Xanthobacteraceae bacterium]